MAIYRPDSNRRIVIVGIVALVAGLVLGLVVGRVTAPSLGSQVAELRTQVAPIRSSLEVVRTEYPKLLAGGADPGGAPSAMNRIQTVFDTVAPTLVVIDAAGTDDLRSSIDALASAIEAKAPEADIEAGIAAVTDALDSVLPADS